MMLRPIAIAAALITAACSPDAGSDAVNNAEQRAEGFGLAVGEIVPTHGYLASDGTSRSFTELSGENGLVLYFNRSLDWCPYCQAQTIEVNGEAAAFAERGYNVAILTYDPVETLAEYADWRDITVTLLSDPDMEMIDRFDVRDPVYTDPEHFAYGVPYPVTYVIGADGVVEAKLWHETGYGADGGYRERITIEDVLGLIDQRAD